MATQVNLRLEDELLERLDAARGDVPRNRWVTSLIESFLEHGIRPAGTPRRPQPGPNVEHVRSSSQAKRGLGPVPKGKG